MSAPDAAPLSSEPVIIARWWRNRRGEAIDVRLTTYNGHHLIDLRTWYTDAEGRLKPGKGFSANVKHLPRLIDALTKALAKARALDLISQITGDTDRSRLHCPDEPVGRFCDIETLDPQVPGRENVA